MRIVHKLTLTFIQESKYSLEELSNPTTADMVMFHEQEYPDFLDSVNVMEVCCDSLKMACINTPLKLLEAECHAITGLTDMTRSINIKPLEVAYDDNFQELKDTLSEISLTIEDNGWRNIY